MEVGIDFLDTAELEALVEDGEGGLSVLIDVSGRGTDTGDSPSLAWAFSACSRRHVGIGCDDERRHLETADLDDRR